MKNNKINNTRRFLMALAAGQLLLSAQTPRTQTEFVPFNQFIEQVNKADAHAVRSQSAKVRNTEAFAEMRGHIQNLYRGVRVSHSFVKDANHFDCIPATEQPTMRALGRTDIAAAPPQSLLAKQKTSKHNIPATDANAQDEFGNAMTCDAGSIPMRRVTMEEMAQFPTLQDFLSKRPEGKEVTPEASTEAAPATAAPAHKYAFMYQHVDNLGGNSSMNLWRPYVDTSIGQTFSLMQQWYVGGSGAGTQTAEVGWQNYPRKYNTENSVLFVYWTADNYSKTGCYNLDCPGFVQVDNTVTLGAGFTQYSSAFGDQWQVAAAFYLFDGNWWLSIEGTWVGYLDGSIYGNGQMSRNAQTIEFGTESVGTTVWPGEGSGYWPTSGWSVAAYQRNVFYYDVYGNAVWADLTPANPSLTCYSTTGPFTNYSDGEVFFYVGGPGGTTCK